LSPAEWLAAGIETVDVHFGLLNLFGNCIRVNAVQIIKESVDSLCRDGADMPIVRVHTKAY